MRQKLMSAFAIVVLLCFGVSTRLVCAQEPAAAPAAQTQPADASANPAKPVEPDHRIKFNFKGATFQQVIEFFSRTTGLPVIWQTPAPDGTLDYISPDSYDHKQALRVLNTVLQSKGVMLRVSKDNLFLQKLDQMQKEDVPTFVGKIPSDVTPDQIVTVVRPLKIAMAKPLAEKLATMVASYGSVIAMEQQNSIVVTETAANVQRILTIIDQLDMEDPDGAVEVFSIKNAKASEIMVPLKALLSQKVEKFVINQQGQQVKIEEEQMPGLQISADDRTNSIIAKGAQQKIDKLREAIQLLDIPAAEGVGRGRSMTTIALTQLTPAEAAGKLNQLYQHIPNKEKPTVIALDDVAKVMILGDDAEIAEGTLLIGELENGPVGRNSAEPAMSVIPLERAAPQAVVGAINSLLNKRQQTSLKLVAGPDGKSLIVAGPQGDVDAVKALMPMLDRQISGDRQVRIVKISSGDPQAIFDQARKLVSAASTEFDVADLQSQSQNPKSEIPNREVLSVALDVDSRLVTLIGSPKALDAFTNALKQLESSVLVEREARRFQLANVMPSELVGPLNTLSSQMLQPTDGSQFIAPNFAAVDQLNTLLITATPDQFSRIVPLVQSLDVAGADAARPAPKLIQLRFADAANLANVLMAQYNQRSAVERKAKPVFLAADPQTNSLIVSAHPDVLPDIQAMVDQLNTIERVDSESRELHIYPLKVARAEDLARTIDEMFPQPPVPLDVRGRPQPLLQKPKPVIVRAEPQTNSLILSVIPGAGVMNLTGELIAQLDIDPSQAPGAEPKSVQVLTIENADATQIAANLDALFNGPGAAGPQMGGVGGRPVIRVDAASNSLLIKATDEQFKTMQEVVSRIDKATIAASRQMRMIAIDPSKMSADEMARALERMLNRGSGDSGKVQVISLEELIKQRENKQAKDGEVPPGASSSILEFNSEWYEQQLRLSAKTQSSKEAQSGKNVQIEGGFPFSKPNSYLAQLCDFATLRSNGSPEARGNAQAPLRSPLPLQLQLAALAIGLTEDPPAPAANEPDVTIAVDKATNSLVILGSSRAIERVSALIKQMQDQIPSAPGTIRYVTMPKSLDVNTLNNLLAQTMDRLAPRGGQPGDLRRRVATIPDPVGNALIIAANDTDFETVADLIAVLSKPAESKFPIHTVTLQRADATAVAKAIQQFFDDRAKLGGGRSQQKTLAVTAIESSNTLLVSASDDDFAQFESLITQFDTVEATAGLTVRVFQLKHARATEIERTVQNLVNDLVWNQGDRIFVWPPIQQTKSKDAIAVRADARLNALIVTGRGDKFDVVEQMIDMLDAAPPQGEQRIVRLYRVDNAPLQTVADVLRESFNQSRQRRPWEPPDPSAINVRIDQVSRSLIVSASEREQAEIKEMIAAITDQLKQLAPGGTTNQAIFIIDLHNVSPETAKNVIETIGLDKQQPADSVSRIVSEPIKISLLAGRNALVVLANPADKETVVGLLKAIDAEPPIELAEAKTRVFRLKNAQAQALGQILTQILNPGDQQSATPLARAVREQVRRLSVSANDGQNGNATRPASYTLDLTKPIRVVADQNLNALVISSTEENLKSIEQVIAMFDQLPISDAVTVQLFPLQNIAAEQFARIVKDIFAQGKQLGKTVISKVPGVPDGAVGKALLNEIAISVDDRTNTVVVAGSEDSVALVEVLSKRIDSDVTAGWVEPKVVPLRFADASDLATLLQAILVEGAGNLPQSSPIQRQIGRLRMLRGQGAGAQTKPQNADGNPSIIESDVFTPMTRLVIKPEPQMNALILIGTPANNEIVSELVAMLDIESASPSNAVRIYPIENASAARLAQTIKQLFDQQVQAKAIRQEDRVTVQADERTNALVVATSPRSFAVLESLLKTLDSKIPPELREIRTLEVKNASASRIAAMIQQMMDARLERMRKIQPEVADLERATVIADPRTNSLIIAAGNDAFEVVKRLASDLDVSTLGDAALVHVIPLEKASIDRIANAVNQIMERRYADVPADVRKSQRPLVLTDSRTNSLLVTANPEDLASIEELVKKLSAAPTNPAVGLHVLSLPVSTRAELIAPRLQRLMADRQSTLGNAATASDKVAIEPDTATNSLIVAANEENLEVIRGLIDVLVQAELANAGGGKQLEVVALTPANRAADIADMLRDLYVQEANRTRGPNTVKVTADDRLNAVLINAPPGDITAIKNLIAQLEGAKPANVVEIKYVPLKSANAIETVSLIENVLSGRGIGARRGSQQATVLKYLREIAKDRSGAATAPASQPAAENGEFEPPVEMEVSAAIRESITLTPDLRTNTIIVSAPKESVAMIEKMIRDLDDSSTGSKNIRIFKLANADAIAMAEILNELFKLKQGRNLYVLKPRESQGGLAGPAPITPPSVDETGTPLAAPTEAGPLDLGGVSGTELTAVPDERQQLSITVDSRTNSLIVSGTPTYLELVAKVVEDLDKLEANEREVFVYQLRNSVAEEVARVIGQFVEQEQKKLVGTLSADQLGSAARLLEREITIQGDKQSNTVLVSASPRYMDRVKEMIKQLDVDPPQVLIQVMLAEVTLDSNDQWGVDLQAMAKIGGAAVTGGYGLATTFVPGLGVPNLAITSSDFSLLIRAMRSQGRLQVLSNPSIMAANNAPARIQVGETIRLPASTSITDAGRTYSTLEKEDLGVILSVTPSINPDGFVRMTVSPEISNLSNRVTQISTDFQSPIITRRTADTTVTVHDGQTIVIGGLISDRFERREEKVPFFGDIPFVGALFRANSEDTAKTELLIVLTPHVIDSPAEFDRVDQITGDEIDRLSVPPEVKQSIRESVIEGTGGLYNSKGERIDGKTKDQGGKE